MNTKGEGGKKAEEKEKESDGPEAQAGQGRGRRHRAGQYWRISQAGVHVLPGTAEFMHCQELKKPL